MTKNKLTACLNIKCAESQNHTKDCSAYGREYPSKLTKAQEKRRAQVSILANMVFEYQGSSSKTQKEQVGLKEASETLDEIINNELAKKDVVINDLEKRLDLAVKAIKTINNDKN